MNYHQLFVFLNDLLAIIYKQITGKKAIILQKRFRLLN